MKQENTKEQWDNLEEHVKVTLAKWLLKACYPDSYHAYFIRVKGKPLIASDSGYFTIGMMIEYLGYAWYKSLFSARLRHDCETCGECAFLNKIYDGQLADALWEAVKTKART